MPCLAIASSAARAEFTSSLAVGFGSSLLTSCCAESSSVPDALPAGSRPILPPSGSGVAAVIPASASAREFTNAVCPNEDMTNIGRLVFSTSNAARVAVVPAGSMPS